MRIKLPRTRSFTENSRLGYVSELENVKFDKRPQDVCSEVAFTVAFMKLGLVVSKIS